MNTREETIKALSEALATVSEALATVAQVEKLVLDLLNDVVANAPSQDPVVTNHQIGRGSRGLDGKFVGKRGPLPLLRASNGAKHTVGLQRRVQLFEDDIRRLHAEGLHITGMARELGLHRDTVSDYLKELGITPNKAKGKNMRRGRVSPLAPTEKEQNELLKQNPWETSNDSG